MPHISDPLLQAYIDGFCNAARVDEIESHVVACDDCRERLESARGAAQRASQLLGALDPGPVHAPSFEELQARAAARVGDGAVEAGPRLGAGANAGTEAALAGAGAAVARAGAAVAKSEPFVPFWRRPAMAWAATLVIAFGLGWLSRANPGAPVDMLAPAESALEGLAAEAPATEPEAEGELLGRAGLASTDELGDRESAAKRNVAETEAGTAGPAPATPAAAPPPQPTPVPEGQLGQLAPRQEVAENRAVPEQFRQAQEAERRLAALPATQDVAAASAALPDAKPAEAAAGMRAEGNEQRGGGLAMFADAGATLGFVAVAPEAARLWLGVEPRVIPELTLLRVEVGPGALLENGIPGRAAVRLVYQAPTGQQIALLQQYSGPLDLEEVEELAQGGQPPAGRAAGADAPARAQAAGEADDLRRDRAKADRDAVLDAQTLPAIVREPGGPVTYRWRDADGYVLSITGDLDPDVLRGIADLVR